jgi:class 3 adenylate cyclase
VLSRVRSQLALKKKSEELLALSKKLSKYLAPQVYVSIFRGEQEAKIESKRKKLTIFFSDIVSFTQTTEGMEAEDLSDLLNSYLEEMATIAIKHGGTIDKFIGDAVLVFFGDPLTRGLKEDALACVSMALEMRETIKTLQEKWYSYGIQEPFKVRMGIATGYCTVGNFGSVSRMDYTIVGSQVNIASRLESSADPDQIVISHETWSLVKDEVFCVKQKPIVVKGISHPIQTYQVVDFAENISDEQKTSTIGLMIEPAHAVSEDITVGDLKTQMDESNPYEAAVVVKAKTNIPVGLIMGYQLSANSDSAVAQIMDGNAYSAEMGTSLDQVVGRALARDKSHIYDPVIVTENGDLKGIVSVHALLAKTID